MNPRRIGTATVYEEASALVVHCPALRSAGPALMLAMFGAACSVIAIASMIGLISAGRDDFSSMLALAFAGVLVLPLFGMGALFIAVALWSAFNSLTVAATAGGIRAERRWCGVLFSRKAMAVETIVAIDCAREARFVGIFSGMRHYRLLARGAAGMVALADHLQGAEETAQVKQLLITALKNPALAAAGRSDHLADAAASAVAQPSGPPSGS